MSIDFFFQFGYPGLFIISFLAASLLPLSSEIFVLAMPPLGYSPWGVGIVATIGNYAGALMNYYVGKKRGRFCFCPLFSSKRKNMEQGRKLLSTMGTGFFILFVGAVYWGSVNGRCRCPAHGYPRLHILGRDRKRTQVRRSPGSGQTNLSHLIIFPICHKYL